MFNKHIILSVLIKLTKENVMFDSIRYSEYLGVAIYNDGSNSGYELAINFSNGSCYYANSYIQYQPEHYMF